MLYKQLKGVSYFENYISNISNHKHRVALTRFRLLSYALYIEPDRHGGSRISREESLWGNEIEDVCVPLTWSIV